MINKDFFAALEDLEREKGIDQSVFIKALETALASACKKNYGVAADVTVKLNPEKATIRVFMYKTVVEEVADPDKEMTLAEAQELKKGYKLGDQVLTEINPRDFGRIAAQTAKQVVMNHLHQAEKDMTYNQFVEKENELLVGIVSRVKDDGTLFVEIGKNQMEGILLSADQIQSERFNPGDKIKVYVKKVKENLKGPQVLLSRTSIGFIKRLFENEVPEIRSGIVEIKAIVREPGFRTKMSVWSNDPEIDPVGACVGNRGVRVNAIVNEIGGEKIDIIPWSSDILDYIARALSPAKVLMVQADESTKEAKVIVPDDKLSLAIGKEGQNARLAARLTNWKIDVKSYTTALQMGLFDNDDEEDESREDETEIANEISHEPAEDENAEEPENENAEEASDETDELPPDAQDGGEL